MGKAKVSAKGLVEGSNDIFEGVWDSKGVRLARYRGWQGRQLRRCKEDSTGSFSKRLDLLTVRREDVGKVLRIPKRNVSTESMSAVQEKLKLTYSSM